MAEREGERLASAREKAISDPVSILLAHGQSCSSDWRLGPGGSSFLMAVSTAGNECAMDFVVINMEFVAFTTGIERLLRSTDCIVLVNFKMQ